VTTRTHSIREIEKAIEARSSSKVPLMYQLLLVAESLRRFNILHVCSCNSCAHSIKVCNTECL
jgi:hypothetical protein